MQITIVGLGPGPSEDLTARAQTTLACGATVLLRTARCGAAQWLSEQGIAFTALDSLYEQAEDFDQLATLIAQAVLDAAQQGGQAIYATPGSGDAQDATVQALCALCQAQGITLACVPGLALSAPAAAQAVSAGDPGRAFAKDALLTVSAAQAADLLVDTHFPLIVTEIDTRIAASGVKLSLLRIYPPEHPILYVQAKNGATIAQTLALVDIDRQADTCYDHTASFYCTAPQTPYRQDVQALQGIMRKLRAPGGCPWDREQTHQSIRLNLIEEAYEVLDAIDRSDVDALCEELGDVLLQVIFHAAMAAEQGDFDLLDVTDGICRKLIHRHPHVFGQTKVSGSEQVLANWDSIKREEKHQESFTQTLRDVPRVFPALLRSQKVQKRAKRAGMDFSTAAQAFEKLTEEVQEVRQALEAGDQDLPMELGDLLFAAVNVVRLSHQDAEDVLNLAVDKFIGRFAGVEDLALSRGLEMQNMPLEQLDLLWNEVKATQSAAAQGKE